MSKGGKGKGKGDKGEGKGKGDKGKGKVDKDKRKGTGTQRWPDCVDKRDCYICGKGGHITRENVPRRISRRARTASPRRPVLPQQPPPLPNHKLRPSL